MAIDNYKRAITELQRDIEKNSGEIHILLRKLGEYLSYQDDVFLSTAEMRELHGRIEDLRRQLPESRQQVKKILQTVAGNEELEREIHVRKRQINELEEKNQGICEAIGRAAYQAYQVLASPEEQYRELFEPLSRQDRELKKLEAEYEQLQVYGREERFFKIFRETGRSLYLKGILSLRRRAVARAYHEVGRRICNSQMRDELKDGGLRAALAPFEENGRKIDALRRETEKLKGAQEKKWKELKTLGAHKSHQKRVREIETEIQGIENRLQDAFEGLGALFRGAPSEELKDAEASGIVKQIEGIDRENRGKRKQIERLGAAMQIDSLQSQLGGISDRISKLEGDIESHRREIETLRAQMTEGEKEIQRLQRIRGSKQLLMKHSDDAERGVTI